MAERYEEVEHNKHKEELTHTIIQGVCMGFTVAAMGAGIVASGGTLAPVIVSIGAVAGMVGGANAISKAARNFDANTLEISQCYNFGKIDVANSAEGAGIVGKMADFSLVTDCITGGEYTEKEYAIVEKSGGKVTVDNCIDLYAASELVIANLTAASDYYANNKIYCYNRDEDWAAINSALNADLLVPETVDKVESYGGWDFTVNKLWMIPDVGTGTAFPLPYVSKMMVAPQEGGH